MNSPSRRRVEAYAVALLFAAYAAQGLLLGCLA